MFGVYDHPATRFVCRHCGKDAGYDPEACFRCGHICGDCFDTTQYPCQEQRVVETGKYHIAEIPLELFQDDVVFAGAREETEQVLRLLKHAKTEPLEICPQSNGGK